MIISFCQDRRLITEMAVAACVIFIVQLTIQLEFYCASPFLLLDNRIVSLEILCVIHSLHRVEKKKVRKVLPWIILSNSWLFENYFILFPLKQMYILLSTWNKISYLIYHGNHCNSLNTLQNSHLQFLTMIAILMYRHVHQKLKV